MSIFRVIGILLLAVSSVAAGNFRAKIDSLKNPASEEWLKVALVDARINLPFGCIFIPAGSLYFTDYREGRPIEAYFYGPGEFVYYPPDNVETQQVRRYYGADSIRINFEQIYFAFPANSDRFDKFIGNGEKTKPPTRVRSRHNIIRNIPDQAFNYNLAADIYKAGAENQPEFLWADFYDGSTHTVYLYNPSEREQVSIYKYAVQFRTPRLVSSFADPGIKREPLFEEYNLYNYDIDLNISTTGRSEIICRMSLLIKSDSLKVLKFDFPNDYSVDSVWGDAADASSFIKEKNRPSIIVELIHYFSCGDAVHINVAYRTNLFYHLMTYGVVQKNLAYWYPYSGHRQLSQYQIHYSIEKGFDFISVGRKTLDTIIENRHVLGYRTDEPVSYISFNYGLFDSFTVTSTPVPVTIYSLSKAHHTGWYGNIGVRRVADDIGGALEFYADNFAPYPFERLIVDDMSISEGQGSPGIIHLSGETFTRSIEGVDDLLRAHETAHQWWGHLVIPATYHDIWLSEGMAEYSAMLYISMVKGENKVFRELMREWRKLIIQKGKAGDKKSDGFQAGAIILGTRLASELSPADYDVINYYKAAYMLHMLRFELDTAYPGEERFMKLLSAFATRFSRRLATSQNFVDIAAEFMGDRAGKFFAQWLYDWRIPKIKKRYDIKDDGSCDITIKVDEIDDRFSSPYPVKFILSDGTSKLIVINIEKGNNSYHFKPDENRSVASAIFNPDYDILER
jgi:hypothetical protein